MGMGPLSSDSKSSQRTQANLGPVTATQGTAQSTQQGGRSKSVSQGGINLEKGANIAGLTLGNIGRGASVTLTTTGAPIDTSGLDAAADALSRLVDFQADHTAASLANVGTLGQPAPTAPPVTSDGSKWFLLVAAAGVGALTLVALAIVRRNR
jgi:hypothetical protein